MTLAPFTPEELKERADRTRKLVTRLMLFAVVMFFAGLTSAYVVSMSGGYWVDIKIPQAFLVSTGAILVSSVLAQLALLSAQRGNSRVVAPYLIGTLVLGLVFTWSQFRGWKELTERGNFLVGKVLDNKGTYGDDYTIRFQGVALIEEDGQFFHPLDASPAKPLNADLDEQKNTSSSFFFALTGAHLAHLVIGLLSLLVMVAMALKQRYTPADNAGLWSGVVYWHFLGILWVYLLLFLVFVH
ncbi:MAG TPA: cytochrome c oxidase subunit 3 [Flavobacteriales bacterium]|nr:cytochrome c oxidase subunit 3 [Flavobacteriales bacterium]